MLSLPIGILILLSSGVLPLTFASPQNDGPVLISIFIHFMSIFLFIGVSFALHFWNFFSTKSRSKRWNYSLGILGLIICVSMEHASCWLIHSCFWNGYAFYLVAHIASFLVLQFLLYPGSSYSIEYHYIPEYFFFIVFFTGFNTELMMRYQVYNDVGIIHAFLNASMSIFLVELHALTFTPIDVYCDRIGRV